MIRTAWEHELAAGGFLRSKEKMGDQRGRLGQKNLGLPRFRFGAVRWPQVVR